MRRKRFLVSALHLILVLVMAGMMACVGPKPERVLRVGVGTFVSERLHMFEPVSPSDTMFLALMYDPLLGVDRDGNLAPAIAKDWEVSEDGKVWTFYIREGMMFHNGDPLTAHDVKATLDEHVSNPVVWGAVDLAATIGTPDNIKIVDEYTLEIQLVKTDVYFWNTIWPKTPTAFIWPKDYVQEYGRDYFKENPIGSGPWRFVFYDSGYRYIFERVDDAAFYENHYRPMPQFDRLEAYLVPEENTRVSMLEADELDIIEMTTGSIELLKKAGLNVVKGVGTGYQASVNIKFPGVELVTDEEAIAHGWRAGMTPEEKDILPSRHALPTADVRVREALSIAIDREAIINEYFLGYADLPMPILIVDPYDPDIDGDKWSKWVEENLVYDPDRAKELLAEAGYPDGFELNFHAFNLPGRPWLLDISQIVTSYWEAIGVHANVKIWDFGAFSAWRKSSEALTDLWGHVSGTAPDVRAALPSTGASYYTWAGWKGGDRPYYFTWETEKLLKDASGEPDDAARRALLDQFIGQVAEQFPMINIAIVTPLYGVGRRVIWEGVRPGMGWWGLDLEYVEPAE